MRVEDIFLYPIVVIIALYFVIMLCIQMGLERVCDYFLYGGNDD